VHKISNPAYLDAVGDIVLAWLWLKQAMVARDGAGDFYAGKRAAARHSFVHELPRVDPLVDLLESLDRSLVDLDDRWL
jgi:butyryl-CoA dehydrogenase